jgi:hydroxypyruvate isomerase
MDFTKYRLNCSILYGSRPRRSEPRYRSRLDRRRVLVAFHLGGPDDEEVANFLQAVADSGIGLKGMNLFAGNMAGGDRGVLSWPRREARKCRRRAPRRRRHRVP